MYFFLLKSIKFVPLSNLRYCSDNFDILHPTVLQTVHTDELYSQSGVQSCNVIYAIILPMLKFATKEKKCGADWVQIHNPVPECICNPITAMGFFAMFTFQLDNTKR